MSSASSGEHPGSTNRPVEDTYGFSYLKTGYDEIFPEFMQDLEQEGIEVVHAAPLRLHPDAIDYIYRDSVEEPFYQRMKHHIATSAMLAMVLEGTAGGEPPQPILASLKRGENGYRNLRKRYMKQSDIVSDEDFKLWCEERHPRQDELTITLTQRNAFHMADDQQDALATLRVIHDTTPDFYIPNDTTNKRKLGRLVDYLFTFSYDRDKDNLEATGE